MRKLLLTILAAGSIAAANAQSAGSILGYGDVGFGTSKDSSKATNTNFNINLGVGYAFTTNWAAGIQGGFGSTTYKMDANNKSSVNDFHIGVFGRYTKPLSNVFAVYGQLDAGYMSSMPKDTYGGVTVNGDKTNGFMVGITPAVQVAVGNWFNLNFSFGGLSYTSTKSSAAGANTVSSFNLNFGQTANIGISKYFGCGHHMHGHHEPGEDMRHMDTSDDSDEDAPKAHHHDKKSKKSKKSKDSDNDDE